ncbi:MAG: hypothetical protein HOL65_04990 [Microbacteriaceae bacterium]|nr:hypothetical protein [Microbacteriaceae bacterium]
MFISGWFVSIRDPVMTLGVIVTGAISFLAGFYLGCVISVYHAWWFPIGLILSLLAVALVLGALRVIVPHRTPAVLGAVGLLSALGLLAGLDNQGSVLIMADNAGFLLLSGVALLVVVSLAWPRFASRSSHYDRTRPDGERMPSS